MKNIKRYPNIKAYSDLAKFMINDNKRIIHEINDFVIHNYNGNIHVINKQSLQIIKADSEKIAVDLCLDFYKSSISNQLEL